MEKQKNALRQHLSDNGQNCSQMNIFSVVFHELKCKLQHAGAAEERRTVWKHTVS